MSIKDIINMQPIVRLELDAVTKWKLDILFLLLNIIVAMTIFVCFVGGIFIALPIGSIVAFILWFIEDKIFDFDGETAAASFILGMGMLFFSIVFFIPILRSIL